MIKKNFECRCSSITGMCLMDGLNSVNECHDKCKDHGVCEECSWKCSEYCKDCYQKDGVE